jgi:hypothetical protein
MLLEELDEVRGNPLRSLRVRIVPCAVDQKERGIQSIRHVPRLSLRVGKVGIGRPHHDQRG